MAWERESILLTTPPGPLKLRLFEERTPGSTRTKEPPGHYTRTAKTMLYVLVVFFILYCCDLSRTMKLRTSLRFMALPVFYAFPRNLYGEPKRKPSETKKKGFGNGDEKKRANPTKLAQMTYLALSGGSMGARTFDSYCTYTQTHTHTHTCSIPH